MNASLENLIDSAGRDEVFDRVRAYGWKESDHIPTWVWQAVAGDIIMERQDANKRKQDGLSGLSVNNTPWLT